MEAVFRSFNLIFLAGFLCYCVMASDWPEGYYGLPMAKTGCPDGATFKWKTGWIYQDTENNNPSSSKSTSFHIEGLVRDSNVNRSFCIKNNVTNDHRRPFWPAGTYCIYQRATNCPLGFSSGSITWDDEDTNNKNKENGSLPKVDLLNTDTKIYFCCRNDGNKYSPIDLPTSSPFYLFPRFYKSCQQVRWAVSTLEWIYYHTEDDYSNYDLVTDPAPYVSGGRYNGHKIYYCYYTSCQFTLNASAGSVKFPRSKNYANGQYCSWRISVKASQTIQVQITHLYLSDINDLLIFYDGDDDSAPLLGTLHGKSSSSSNMNSGMQSSSSNLFIMFRSNGVYSSAGFQFSYTTTDTVTAPPLTTTTTVATAAAATTTETELLTDRPQTTDRPDIESTSRDRTTPTFEPSRPQENSSNHYEMFKKSCVQQSQSALTAVAIVIPVICMIAVIAMTAYLFLRLRTLREKSSNVSVRYFPESVNNPSYVPGDAVRVSSETSDTYKNNEEDVYHEIAHQTQASDNPLYQSTDTDADKHLYASFA